MQLTEEQKMLRDGADRFAKEYYDFDTRRKRAKAADGFDRELWAMITELGWPMLAFAEEEGGMGGRVVDLLGVYEAFGRGLVLEPFFAALTLGGGFVRHAANAERKEEVITGLIGGERLVSAALLEPRRRHDLLACDSSATARGGGYVLNGVKTLCLAAGEAQDLVVLARTSGAVGEAEGRTLFLVPADAKGVSRKAYRLRDDHIAGDVTLDGVEVGAEAIIGELDGASSVLDAVFGSARVCLAAEALGLMDACCALTKEYGATRKQFGRPIISFQVLTHRLTDMFVETETTRSLIYKAAASEGSEAFGHLAQEAKLKSNLAGLQVTKEAIQIHGGIGVTEELIVGHYYRRMMTISMLLGTAHELRQG